MFVMPLGLQAKTRDFPWVTLAILIVTVIYSVANFDVLEKFAASYRNDPATIARIQAQKKLAVAACSSSEFTTEECSFLQFTLQADKRESVTQFAKRFFREAKARKISSESTQALADYVTEPWTNVLEETLRLPEYTLYLETRKAESQARAGYAREAGLLARATFSVWSLVRAQFLHADWKHLLGNMIFFLIFAIPLEQRIGVFGFLLVYFVGGSAGLTIELLASHDLAAPVLGASANISAVAAAFMIAFWGFSFRVWVSLFFVVNQIVFVPTWIFIAAFVVIQDVGGALNPSSDGVAHLAHLGGFGLGCVFGILVVQLRLLPKGFAFPFELDLFRRARAEDKTASEKLVLLRMILFHNPLNRAALVEAWSVVCGLPDLTWEQLPRSAKTFLRESFCDLLNLPESADKDELKKALLIAAGSPGWPWAELIPEAQRTRLKVLASELETKSRPEARVLRHLLVACEQVGTEFSVGAGREVQRRQTVA